MGGIVAQLAVSDVMQGKGRGWNASDVAAIITMSSPNSLAPARLDPTIHKIYKDLYYLGPSTPPIISLCGGSTDTQIPSEICSLPPLQGAARNARTYRRTVHTTALPGVWTGVGHREMVWCHQVRWRVARAALELSVSSAEQPSVFARPQDVLERWFPRPVVQANGQGKPVLALHPDFRQVLPVTENYQLVTSKLLQVEHPGRASETYVLPVPPEAAGSSRTFSLLLAKGALIVPNTARSLAPHHLSGLQVALHYCTSATFEANFKDSWCEPLNDRLLKRELSWKWELLPLPQRGASRFPDQKGVDESEAVLYFHLEIHEVLNRHEWIAIQVQGGSGSNDEWVVAGFNQEQILDSMDNNAVNRESPPLHTRVPVAISASSLFVHRLDVSRQGSCEGMCANVCESSPCS
ncbi:hypothetical protein DL93DRAFT_2073586 [Clavulina sp. PMI_390]|nr:hypothetical protein DL93DRAFT_2073586 [Clavulina sp. PMI_390]